MESKKYSKAELVERIQQSYTALEELLGTLTEAQCTQPGPEGWAVKDHLTHITAWERGMAALLSRKPRFEAMGLSDDEVRSLSEDEMNGLIMQRNAHLSAGQALETFRSAHRQFLSVLETLSDADLYRPYDAYLPSAPPVDETDPSSPVINWIFGNTYQHFDEHAGWIKEIVLTSF